MSGSAPNSSSTIADHGDHRTPAAMANCTIDAADRSDMEISPPVADLLHPLRDAPSGLSECPEVVQPEILELDLCPRAEVVSAPDEISSATNAYLGTIYQRIPKLDWRSAENFAAIELRMEGDSALP
jgi:hypothetical protein